MKKRMICAVFTAMMALSLAACGGESQPKSNASSAEKSQPESSAVTSEEQPSIADAGDLGDYHVVIKDAAFGQDYEGNPMIVVNYDFTNNSAENATPLWAVGTKAFQDGVELETAIAMDDTVYNAATAQKEIQPGVTIENCQIAYVLTSTSPVEFEASELISLSDDKLTKTFEVPAQ